MIKEVVSQKDKAVVLYGIDTKYNVNLHIVTAEEFYELCNGA